MVEMGQILLEVNLDSPLNNTKKIMLWWPGSATVQVESISSTFDDSGIDYDDLAGSDNIRTYCDIDPSPSLLPSGVSVETIAKLTHDKLLHNAEFVRQVHLVALLQELLEFRSKTTLNETVLWTLAHCKTDPDVNLSAGNKSRPSMQRAIHHKDSSLISEEDWKAMHQSAILIPCTHIETLNITPYHKYLSEQVKKGAAKKLGKSTPKKPMERMVRGSSRTRVSCPSHVSLCRVLEG
ncbi:hypothetical protein EDB83DRAFT_2320826 [Lactarius deliciosus]|nr:hypothetical protein EDB83DRAFT_2320826 [Lactarius deliciosus]